MRVFFSTGELSGELLAAELLEAMRAQTAIEAEGIGDERLAAAGVRIVQRNRGWASLGALAAVRRIPPLGIAVLRLAARLLRRPPDLVVLVDFGAFNLRFARLLRMLGFRRPIVYYAPPGVWFDDPRRARRVASCCDALTIFAHQAAFYRSLALPIGYVGHPLVSTVAPRPLRASCARDDGVVALLPGSRSAEIAFHAPVLLDALATLRRSRTAVRAVLVAASDDVQRQLEALLALRSPLPVTIVRDARRALREADAAAVASGTAVLEAALIGTPVAAFYILPQAQYRLARRVYRRPYVTLPNLVLDAALVPELLQHAVTPDALAAVLEALLAEPRSQAAGFARLRELLGPADALARNAAWVVRSAERAA
ncbi:MAG: hypothetical protein JOZ24_04500 [Candidatus Eremiobacteraeota bacterium]|nr:hypothetical protein [Candidatus Eremiobacteraeota bacterium]